MERLAVGELQPVEREVVLSHPLARFIVREEKDPMRVGGGLTW